MDPRYNQPPYGPPHGQPGGYPQQHPHAQQPYQQAPYAQGPYGQAQYGPAGYPQPGYAQPYPQQYHPAAYGQPTMDAQRMMLYDANKKSALVAYALWFFLGAFGGHRFYLDRSGSAALQLVINIFSWALMIVFVGFFSLAALGLWLLIDAFLIPDWVREHNNRLIARMNYA